MEETTPVPAATNSGKREVSQQERDQINSWQKKLLPWLILMPTVLILLFVYLATRQMQRFNAVIDAKTESAIDRLVPLPSDTLLYNKLKGNMDYIRWITLA